MKRKLGLPTLMLAALFVLPTTANAAVATGSVIDAVDYPADPARDIRSVSSDYDSDAGTWMVRVRFEGPLNSASRGRFKVRLSKVGSSCGSGTGTEYASATLSASTDPDLATDTSPPTGGLTVGDSPFTNGAPMTTVTREFTPDMQGMVLTGSHQLMVGWKRVCVLGISLSKNPEWYEGPSYDTAYRFGLSTSPDDVDGDGVVDRVDKCPETPAATRSGCSPLPAPPVTDLDGDRLDDKIDLCPLVVGPLSLGCPTRLDSTAPKVKLPSESIIRVSKQIGKFKIRIAAPSEAAIVTIAIVRSGNVFTTRSLLFRSKSQNVPFWHRTRPVRATKIGSKLKATLLISATDGAGNYSTASKPVELLVQR